MLFYIGVIRCYCCDGHHGEFVVAVRSCVLWAGVGTFLFGPFRALSGPFSSDITEASSAKYIGVLLFLPAVWRFIHPMT